MLHTTTKQLEICIDVNIEISKIDQYTWIFTSRIFRIPLEITSLLNKYFFSCKWLTSYSHEVEKLLSGGVLIKAGDWKILKN